MIGFYLFVMIVITQRIIELKIAKRNEQWILKQGGYEVGKEHYKFIVTLHVFFFVSLLVEVTIAQPPFAAWVIIPFVFFMVAQFGRIWVITTLGHFWNTRIFILPNAKLVTTGPYRYMKHPNYFVVMIEIASLPLIFQAYWTAMIFSILNLSVLSYRIHIENKALSSGYQPT